MTEVALGPYRLEIATEFGPRVTSLRRGSGPDMLARLGPEVRIEHDAGVYHFRGGHRLWASPEVPEFTYVNDDHRCDVEFADGLATVTAGVDDAGFSKEITVSLEGDRLLVGHVLTREPGAVEGMAAWSITQFPLDGVAILPLGGPESGPLPNRQLVLWPYTSLEDDRLLFTERGIEIVASHGDPVKLGTGPRRPRLGYLRDGQLFVKEFVSASDGEVPDLGAGAQIYVGQGFCELEMVGGMTDGTVATVNERWWVTPCDDVAAAWEILTGGSDR